MPQIFSLFFSGVRAAGLVQGGKAPPTDLELTHCGQHVSRRENKNKKGDKIWGMVLSVNEKTAGPLKPHHVKPLIDVGQFFLSDHEMSQVLTEK